MTPDPLPRNIAEVIADLSHDHPPPRDHERLIALVQRQIEHVQLVTARPLNAEIEQVGKELARLRDDAAITSTTAAKGDDENGR